jgi:chemotaxis signal transduction protein
VTERSRPSEQVERLRRAFDDAFAAPAALPARDAERLLAIRVAGEPFAIRVLETVGLLAARKIVPMPTRRPEVLGLTAIRGALLPVFSLAGLLGLGAVPDDARWFVLAGRRQPVALAFGRIDAQVEVPRAELHGAADAGPSGPVRELATVDGHPRPLVDIPTLLRGIAGT